MRPPRKSHWRIGLVYFLFLCSQVLFLIGPTLILAYRSLEGARGGIDP